MSRAGVAKALAALFLALTLTATYGVFSGYPEDPDFVRIRQAQIESIHREFPVMTDAERQQKWDEGLAKLEPPRRSIGFFAIVCSAIDWYSTLLGISFLAFLILLRPPVLGALLIVGVAGIPMFVACGVRPISMLALGLLVFAVLRLIWTRTQAPGHQAG